eukprot:TRINITY_DN19386_c0_g1_i1.p1 TRINITY_DN19386_c0_g1~~TRINITY_DN19386_c0_g1_i1.p1  ORF type:complete len:286 (+),score=6.61 TRINITY_DN19386_c0_g1_i1:31-888(+)
MLFFLCILLTYYSLPGLGERHTSSTGLGVRNTSFLMLRPKLTNFSNEMIPYMREVRNCYSSQRLSKKIKRKQAKLLRLYNVTRDWLEAVGVSWWLDFGSLLGWYRDGKLLPGDRDVDFSTTEQGWQKLKQNSNWLHKYKCSFTDTSYRHTGPKGVIACSWFSTKLTNGADLYGFVRNGSSIRSPTGEGCRVGKNDLTLPCSSSVCWHPTEWYFPVNCSYGNVLHGRNVCVPRRVHRILTRYYGSINRNATCKKCCSGGEEIPVMNPVNDTPYLPYWHSSGRWEGW